MIRIPGFHCHGLGSVLGPGTEIPQAMWHSQKKKKKKMEGEKGVAPYGLCFL